MAHGHGCADLSQAAVGRGVQLRAQAPEYALRGEALGRKNYLFLCSNAGADRAAAIYALIGTARLNAVEPEAYLRHVLERIADHPISRIDELLPWNVTLEHDRQDARKAACYRPSSKGALGWRLLIWNLYGR